MNTKTKNMVRKHAPKLFGNLTLTQWRRVYRMLQDMRAGADTDQYIRFLKQINRFVDYQHASFKRDKFAAKSSPRVDYSSGIRPEFCSSGNPRESWVYARLRRGVEDMLEVRYMSYMPFVVDARWRDKPTAKFMYGRIWNALLDELAINRDKRLDAGLYGVVNYYYPEYAALVRDIALEYMTYVPDTTWLYHV